MVNAEFASWLGVLGRSGGVKACVML